MLALSATARIYLYQIPCDMRKSFDALCGLVRSDMGADPLSGSFFVFINRRRNLLKCLYWDRDGFALWYKRLEKGCFRLPDQCATDGRIDRLQLTLLLEGVVAKKVSRRYILEK
jgi:transposase